MSKGTPATLWLSQQGIAYETRRYDYDADSPRIGLQAAEAMGEPPSRVLKTLMTLVDGKPVCVILPSDRELSMKKVAAAFSGKSAGMMPVADAERISGYKVGGVSPFGQRRQLPTAIEASALAEPYVYVNGGQRGLQAKLAPADLQRALQALSVDIVA